MLHSSHLRPAPRHGRKLARSIAASITSQRRQVIAAARRIEPDRAAASLWFDADPILACGGLTARELVHKGRRAEVLRFLDSIRKAAETPGDANTRST